MTSQFTITLEQTRVLNDLIEWLNQPDSTHITVGGYAGTGKSTILGVLRKHIHSKHPKKKIAFACFTGKAAQVIKQKIREHSAVYLTDFCGTIHSLLYSPQIDNHGRVQAWKKNTSLPYDLLIIDEASMIPSHIWDDLKTFHIPIIAVGDHGQLPPIDPTGFNLMQKPRLTLGQIHRQAANNPILQVAQLARETGKIPFQQFSSTVLKVSSSSDEAQLLLERILPQFTSDCLVLCARNRTRNELNRIIRNALHFEYPEPFKGETIICLKNSYETNCGPIYNGMIGKILSIQPLDQDWYQAQIQFIDDQRIFQGVISRHQFFQEKFIESVPGIHYSKIGARFDFGYALTVHKAQGSQAKRVILFEEKSAYTTQDEYRRWLYTAITRSTNELYILG